MLGAKSTFLGPAGLSSIQQIEIVGNRDLIRVAVARMPSQAVPLSGRYWGSADDELGIEVEVNVKTERDSAIP